MQVTFGQAHAGKIVHFDTSGRRKFSARVAVFARVKRVRKATRAGNFLLPLKSNRIFLHDVREARLFLHSVREIELLACSVKDFLKVATVSDQNNTPSPYYFTVKNFL